MGNTLSSFGGQKRVQNLINKSGLPLQIDDSVEDDSKTPLSTFTEAYPAPGWFTGVKSAITIHKPASVVYDSLAKDLQRVFTPMSECDDEIQEDDGAGRQAIFRIVRIPFKVAFVTGNLKLRLNVKQDKSLGQIHFESAKEGRLITRFIADFHIHASEDRPEETIVKLDSKVNCKSLPPAPFRNMVKDVMVRKMDSCMVDLLNFHQDHDSDDDEFESASETSFTDRVPSSPSIKPQKSGFMEMVRSLSAPLRRSLEYLEPRRSVERSRKSGLTDSAHGVLGHDPREAPGQVPTPVAQSALYTPSTSSTKVVSFVDDKAVSSGPESSHARPSQSPSQVSVFAKWQEETGPPPATVF